MPVNNPATHGFHILTFRKPFLFSLPRFKRKIEILIGTLSPQSAPIKNLKSGTSARVSILIGPEGGWSEKEELLGEENGFTPFSLGSNTLRLETAAICGLAVARESFIL